MKLNALQQAIREHQFFTVALLACSIAIVLIAGFTTGVLTGQPDQERPQQTDKLLVVNGTAHVTENSTIDYVNLTVRPGSRDVNLSTTTIEWLGPNGARNLVFEDEAVSDPSSDTATPDDGRHFAVVSLRDDDRSTPVVNDQTDRFKLVINATAVSGQQLAPGDTVEVKLITSYHAVTQYTITIPASLDDQTTVEV